MSGSFDRRKEYRVVSTCLLTCEHRQARLQWCLARSIYSLTDWTRISSEISTTFNWELMTNEDMSENFQECGEMLDYHPPHTKTMWVMVWDTISFNGRTPLASIHDTLISWKYAVVVLPFLSRHLKLKFEQDNARLHTAIVSTESVYVFTCLLNTSSLPSQIEL